MGEDEVDAIDAFDQPAAQPVVDDRRQRGAGRVQQRELDVPVDEAEVAAAEVVVKQIVAHAELVIAQRRVDRKRQAGHLGPEAGQLIGRAAAGQIARHEGEADPRVLGHAPVDVLHAIDRLLDVGEHGEAPRPRARRCPGARCAGSTRRRPEAA